MIEWNNIESKLVSNSIKHGIKRACGKLTNIIVNILKIDSVNK